MSLNSPPRECYGIVALSRWVNLLFAGCWLQITGAWVLGCGRVGVLQIAGGGCASELVGGLVGFGVFCASLLLCFCASGLSVLRASGLSLHIHALLTLLASPIFHSLCPVVAE